MFPDRKGGDRRTHILNTLQPEAFFTFDRNP